MLIIVTKPWGIRVVIIGVLTKFSTSLFALVCSHSFSTVGEHSEQLNRQNCFRPKIGLKGENQNDQVDPKGQRVSETTVSSQICHQKHDNTCVSVSYICISWFQSNH